MVTFSGSSAVDDRVSEVLSRDIGRESKERSSAMPSSPTADGPDLADGSYSEPRFDGLYRLAAIPAQYSLSDDVVLQDSRERFYVLERHTAHLILLDDDEAALVMGFSDLSQDNGWRTYFEWTRLLCPAAYYPDADVRGITRAP